MLFYPHEQLPEWELIEAEDLVVLKDLAHQYLFKGNLLEGLSELVLFPVPGQAVHLLLPKLDGFCHVLLLGGLLGIHQPRGLLG